MDRFDRRRWQAELCRTQEELDFALDCFGVRGKRVDHVYTIGKAEWVHDTGRFAYSGRNHLPGTA